MKRHVVTPISIFSQLNDLVSLNYYLEFIWWILFSLMKWPREDKFWYFVCEVITKIKLQKLPPSKNSRFYPQWNLHSYRKDQAELHLNFHLNLCEFKRLNSLLFWENKSDLRRINSEQNFEIIPYQLWNGQTTRGCVK